MNLRDNNVKKLAGNTFDVLIIGAGINGAVAATALAARAVAATAPLIPAPIINTSKVLPANFLTLLSLRFIKYYKIPV
jgi:hypothetical protein